MMKSNYYISADGKIRKSFEIDNERVEIGNYFVNEGKAEKTVEKLKAWKRLRDIGYSFDRWNVKSASSEGDHLLIDLYIKDCTGCEKLLNLLFGGEE